LLAGKYGWLARRTLTGWVVRVEMDRRGALGPVERHVASARLTVKWRRPFHRGDKAVVATPHAEVEPCRGEEPVEVGRELTLHGHERAEGGGRLWEARDGEGNLVNVHERRLARSAERADAPPRRDARDEAQAREASKAAAERARIEAAVAALQQARTKAGERSSEAQIRAAARRSNAGARVTAEQFTRACSEEEKRRTAGAAHLGMHAINHGGMVMRLRAALRKRPQLRGLVDDEDLIWQSNSKLYTTMKRIQSQASVAVVSETHREGSRTGQASWYGTTPRSWSWSRRHACSCRAGWYAPPCV